MSNKNVIFSPYLPEEWLFILTLLPKMTIQRVDALKESLFSVTLCELFSFRHP